MVLSICAYLSSDHLNQDLLESCCQKKIGEAVELLINYSIVSQYDKGLKIHRSTQAVMRLIHERSGLDKQYFYQVFNWLFPKMDYEESDLQDIGRVSLIIPHAVNLCHIKNPLDPTKLSTLYEKIARHQLYAVGNPNISLEYFNKSLMILEANFSKDHPDIARTLTNLGNAWGDLGDYEKQKDLLIRALAIHEKHFGKDHPSTGITLTNLGIAWGSLGDHEKMKDLLIRALAINEKHFGKDHPQTGITLANLGQVLCCVGDFRNAFIHQKKAHQIF